MNLKQRYKSKSKRRIFRFLGFYSILAFFLLFYNTFARYTTVVQNESKVAIANWHISINNNNILNSGTLTNTIELIPTTQTTTDNKLAPGQSGYFDISINPEGTDVGIQYIINFDTTNIPTGILLDTYEILENGITGRIENSKIEGEINLQQMQQLTSSEKKTIRVYWKWSETSTEIPTGEEKYKIQATITVKQKIN